MRDWLERNIRGSLNAEGLFHNRGPERVSNCQKGEIGTGIFPLTRSNSKENMVQDQDSIILLFNSLMDCRNIESMKKVLSEDLRSLIDYDVGSLKWKPLDPEDAEPASDFMEDEMVYSMDFTTRRSLKIGDEQICKDEGIGVTGAPRYVDSFSGTYRARSEMGDPVLISFRSAIFIPLNYADDHIGSLSLFSSNRRRSGPDIEKMLNPVWSMIGKTLGRILEIQSLREDLQRARDLLDGTDDMIILWRNRGSLWEIDCNERAEELMEFGYIPPELMEGPFFVPPGREWERAFVAWSAAFQSGEANQICLDLLNKNGETVSYLCKFSPLMDQGETAGVRMTGVEMEMLNVGAKKMESSNKTYRLLLSVLSHDLRNPLTAIRGYNEMMEFADEDKRLSYINKISNLTRRMNDMINLASTFTKLQEGKIETSFEIIDIREMVDRCLDLLYPRTEEHRIVFSHGESNFKIKGHRLLEQVVLNLLENAMKYSDEGSEIVIDLETDLSGVLVSVSDQGKGIPDQFKLAVFERFSRVNNSPGILGSGLGLAISKEIVSIHGGRIWVVDNEGGGARFNVFLPWEP